jgi:hypothetical protein
MMPLIAEINTGLPLATNNCVRTEQAINDKFKVKHVNVAPLSKTM